jgi:hypothetical protein
MPFPDREEVTGSNPVTVHQVEGHDGEGQAEGQARSACGEPPQVGDGPTPASATPPRQNTAWFP